MSETLESINQEIDGAVDSSKYLTLKTHRMTTMVEKHIQHAVETILTRNERPALTTTLYTVLKELVINGCKANQKRIFFEERGLDISNAEDYVQGNAEYRTIFSEEMALEYGVKARERGYYVLVDFEFDKTGVKIEVINNTPIAPQEEEAMRGRLKRAMEYEDIAEFYMDMAMQGEEEGASEGAGLGIALIIILLKGEGVDPNLFRIIIEGERTIARLEIPFTEQFVSKRDQPSSVP